MSSQQQSLIRIDRGGPGCLISILWFIFIGSWLSFFWSVIAWIMIVLIIPMPIGLAMLHRVPLIASLRQPTREYVMATEGTATRIQEMPLRQHPFIIRAIYFLLIGWWFSFLWMSTAWLTTATLILMPIGIWMMNRLPAVATLQRY